MRTAEGEARARVAIATGEAEAITKEVAAIAVNPEAATLRLSAQVASALAQSENKTVVLAPGMSDLVVELLKKRLP